MPEKKQKENILLHNNFFMNLSAYFRLHFQSFLEQNKLKENEYWINSQC